MMRRYCELHMSLNSLVIGCCGCGSLGSTRREDGEEGAEEMPLVRNLPLWAAEWTRICVGALHRTASFDGR